MYVINDLTEFATYIRKISLHKFSQANQSVSDEFSTCLSEEKNNTEDENVISIKEVENIIVSLIKKNKRGEFLLSSRILIKIIEEINERIVTNLLNILVNKNIIESAFDEKTNDFIFWVKEKND